MIVAKPKTGTLFSLGVFIALSLVLSGFAIGHMLSGKTILWYHYALAFIFSPIGVGLLFRLVLGYRVVTIGKAKFEVNFPSRFKKRTYKLKDIEKWKETKVKTISGTYRELEIFFNDKKHITLSMQEHTEYPKVTQYLKKKCAKLRSDA